MSTNTKQRVAPVTGGSRRIGPEAALRLASESYVPRIEDPKWQPHIVPCRSTSPERLST